MLRDSGYHVFFRAATAGGLLVVVAYALVQCMNWACPAIGLLWTRFVPFVYSGTFMLSAVLGFVLPPLINLFYKDVMVAERAAVETGDLIELLIAECTTSLDDDRPGEARCHVRDLERRPPGNGVTNR